MVSERDANTKPVVIDKSGLVSYADIIQMGRALAASGLFGIKTPEQAIALMLLCQAEGLHPAVAARDYDIIQGRPAKKSEAMLRTFLANGGQVEWHELTDTKAEATFSHPTGGCIRLDWTLERAKKAGLGDKDVWKRYPRQMLRARLISEGVRTVCPIASAGQYVPEEIIDMDGTVTTVFRRNKGGVSYQAPALPEAQIETPAISPEQPQDAANGAITAKQAETLRKRFRETLREDLRDKADGLLIGFLAAQNYTDGNPLLIPAIFYAEVGKAAVAFAKEL